MSSTAGLVARSTLTAKGRATRQRIVEGAAEFLRGEGPGAPGGVTLDDIRAVTRTSKSQLFHYFPGGKDELLLTIARYEADRELAEQQPHLSVLTSWAAWERWRDAVVARYRAQGRHCPMAVLMNQIRETPGAGEVSTVLLADWEAFLRRGIEQMQSAGKIRREVDAARAAAALLAGIQGGVQMLIVTGSTYQLESSLDVGIAYLRGA